MIEFKNYLQRLISNEPLSEQDMHAGFKLMVSAPKAQQAAFLSLLSARGETVEELVGLLKFLKEQAIIIKPKMDLIDIVGTGGDGLKTFNISTASSLVVASQGVKVAKHGGRAITSYSGSTDVLEHLRIPLYDSAERILHQLKKYHFSYLCAPLFNPVLRALAPLRRELGMATFINILGPLANPTHVKRQVIGVYRTDLLPKIIQVLKATGSIHSLVVRSSEGMDEFSVSSPTTVMHLQNGVIREYSVSPEEIGLKTAPLEAVIGGTAEQNAKIIRDIFSGKLKGPCLDIVLFNAAAGFLVADRVTSLQEGVELARKTIEAGNAHNLLNNLSGSQ